MEPRQEAAPGGERAPVPSAGYEGVSSVERQPGLSPERAVENRPELGQVQAEAAQIAMPTLPAPVVVTPQDTGQAASDDSGAPIVANDDDLIEKEWVDKAKQIISETKDDPYRREREINKLQIEYIRRRYGREIGDSGD